MVDMPRPTHGWLLGHGRQRWEQTRALLDECTCMWADLGGWHVASAPADAPLATHLWAWGNARWLRVRVEGVTAICGELRLNGSVGEAVTFYEQSASNWAPGHGRVNELPEELAGRLLRLRTVEGAAPLTFVELIS